MNSFVPHHLKQRLTMNLCLCCCWIRALQTSCFIYLAFCDCRAETARILPWTSPGTSC